jgi:hypothetical protein
MTPRQPIPSNKDPKTVCPEISHMQPKVESYKLVGELCRNERHNNDCKILYLISPGVSVFKKSEYDTRVMYIS